MAVTGTGFEGSVHYNATLETDVATAVTGYTEWTLVRDASAESSITAADASSRASRTKSFRAGMVDETVTLQVLEDGADATLSAIRAHARAGTAFAMAIMSDGAAVDGSTGVIGNWIVESFGRAYPLDDIQVVDITLKPHSFVGDIEISA
jgi:hypothetical protein